MKFENTEAIFELIKSLEAVPDWVNKARYQHKDLKALVYGEEYKDLILRIEHIEDSKKAIARQKYSRPIKDVFRKILAPVDNIFSAGGGTKQYKLNGENASSSFIKIISNTRENKSLEQFIQTYIATDLYIVDPCGLIFMEWADGKTYPTYKSIDSIRYYKGKGQEIDYVVFEPIRNENQSLWRVVDNSTDYTIIQEGSDFRVDETKTVNHIFEQCPGIIISDKKRLGREGRLSPIDDIIEVAKEFLRDRSILTIHKFLNGFSVPYRPGVLCPECRGTKKQGIEDCSMCDGKGLILETDVTSEIILPIDLNAENPPQLPTNWAGFISPDLEIWKQYRDELKELFKEMFEAVWGTRESDEVKDQTAMGVIMNTQPMLTQLNKWSDAMQSHEKAISKFLLKYYYPAQKIEPGTIVVNYGRNYIVQPPEFLLTEYQKSNEKEDPMVIRDRSLHEYITAKYKNDPEMLREELTKKELEPYIHYDIKTVNDIYGPREARKKGWFTDFWESLNEGQKMLSAKELEPKMQEYFLNRNNDIGDIAN